MVINFKEEQLISDVILCRDLTKTRYNVIKRDRGGKVNFSPTNLYDNNKLKECKVKYSSFDSIFKNWLFQEVVTSTYERDDYLLENLKKINSQDFLLSNNPYELYGAAYSILSLLDIIKSTDVSRYTFSENGKDWSYSCLKLSFLFLSHYVCHFRGFDFIKTTDIYANIARLFNYYQVQFHTICFSAGMWAYPHTLYISNMYDAFSVVSLDPLKREEYHKNSLMMYQNDSVRVVTGDSYYMDNSFLEVVELGKNYSLNLYLKLREEYQKGLLSLSDKEIENIYNCLTNITQQNPVKYVNVYSQLQPVSWGIQEPVKQIDNKIYFEIFKRNLEKEIEFDKKEMFEAKDGGDVHIFYFNFKLVIESGSIHSITVMMDNEQKLQTIKLFGANTYDDNGFYKLMRKIKTSGIFMGVPVKVIDYYFSTMSQEIMLINAFYDDSIINMDFK